MKPYVYEVKAKFSDTDLYGVVHHSNYFRWIEEARIQLMEEILELSVDWLEKEELRFPVIRVEGKYRKSVLARDFVCVNTYLKYSGAAKLVFTYEVVDVNQTVCFKGISEHAVTKGNKMLLKMPQEFDTCIKDKIREYGEGYFITC